MSDILIFQFTIGRTIYCMISVVVAFILTHIMLT